MKPAKIISLILVFSLILTACCPVFSVSASTDNYGDVSGDSSIDMKDVLALRKNLAGLHTEINFINADVNRDNRLDMKDVLLLRQFLANMDVHIGIRQLDKLVSSPCTQQKSNTVWQADKKLLSSLKEKHPTKNYVFSPASLNYVMALAILGSDGNTKDQLLQYYGFESLNDFYSYIAGLQSLQYDSEGRSYLKMAGSIWYNQNLSGGFTAEYTEAAKQYFQADSHIIPFEEAKDQINQWVAERTDNKIKSLLDDPLTNDDSLVLLNALALKDDWKTQFLGSNDFFGDFTQASGDVIQRKFIKKVDLCQYAEDGNTQAVILPTKTNLKAAFVLGDCTDIFTLLGKAKQEAVQISIPSFRIESAFAEREIINWMEKDGPLDLFSGNADLSLMIQDNESYINRINQKAVVAVGGQGVAAVAATGAIGAKSGDYYAENPKIFTADKPFTFVIYSEDDNGAFYTLFYGAVNE